MKDIDTVLSKHPPKPKRPLSTDFTQVVAAHVVSEKPNLLQKLRSVLPGRLFTKAGAASLAAVVLLSGTVAAITLWPQPEVTPTIKQQLPNGNRIVGYDARDCNYFTSLDGSELKPTSEKLYYEIRQDSSLTDDQLRDSLRALCEENISGNAVSAIVKTLPQDLPGMFSTSAHTIDAITEDSITLSPDENYKDVRAAPWVLVAQPSTTYAHFADDLRVYNQGSKAAFSDLKAGDSVKLIMQDTSGRSTETANGYNPLNSPETITVLAIVKVPPLSGDPHAFYQAAGSDLVRLEPCDSSPTGFCRAYEFAR